MAAGCEQEWRDFRILDGSFPIDKTASQERLLFHISGALVDNEPDVIPALVTDRRLPLGMRPWALLAYQ